MKSFAATAPINPSGTNLILTVEQVWKGLNIKARNPATFVPMITACEIIKDEGKEITRKVQFGHDKPFVTEEITSFEPTIGIRITNIISNSPSNELLLTFSFANGIPGVLPGETPTPEELNARIGKGVEHSIERIRELVRDGTIV